MDPRARSMMGSHGAVASSVSAVEHVPCSASGAAPFRIVAYGDSLTAGAPSMHSYVVGLAEALTAAGCPTEVVVCGLCAATTTNMWVGVEAPLGSVRDIQSRAGAGLATLVAPPQVPDLVLLMAGTNDLADPSARAQQIFGRLRSLHEACF